MNDREQIGRATAVLILICLIIPWLHWWRPRYWKIMAAGLGMSAFLLWLLRPGVVHIVLEPGAQMPQRAHDTDAGLDLCTRERRTIPPMGSAVFDTGVHIQLPYGCYGKLESKSGLYIGHGIISTGVIDEGYTGSIRVRLVNMGREEYTVEKGEKITQLLIIPCRYPCPKAVNSIRGGERGQEGFGSTGLFCTDPVSAG